MTAFFKNDKDRMQAMTLADKAVDGTILSQEYLCMEDHLIFCIQSL